MSLLFNMLSRLVIGEGNGTPLQYSCLEIPMDGGAWWAAVHGVPKSRTRLSDFTFTFHFSCIGEGNGNPLQCSCLENPRDRGAWWTAIYGVAQSQTRLKWLSSRLIIAFLPRSKHLLISWLQSSSAVILEHPQNTLGHDSTLWKQLAVVVTRGSLKRINTHSLSHPQKSVWRQNTRAWWCPSWVVTSCNLNIPPFIRPRD